VYEVWRSVAFSAIFWTRIALTEEQVDRHDLRRLQIDKLESPPSAGSLSSSRRTLSQQVIEQIVRDKQMTARSIGVFDRR
jgi:hypothetical protein